MCNSVAELYAGKAIYNLVNIKRDVFYERKIFQGSGVAIVTPFQKMESALAGKMIEFQ